MKQTITKKIFTKILFIVFPLLVFICFGWFYSLKLDTQEDINTLRFDHLQAQKKVIKDHVDIAINFINTSRETRIKRVKSNLQDNIHQAYSFIENSYDKYHETMSKEELKEMITSALRKIKFLNGRGYYFITRMDGQSVMHGKIKSIEKTNFVTNEKIDSSKVHKKITDLLSKQNEGFVEYNWLRTADINGKVSKKVSYIKYFEPYDWYIGAGDYIENIDIELKKDVVEVIKNIRFGKDGYIFISDYKGISIAHVDKQFIGKNSYNLKDSNGLYFIQEFIKIAKENISGGYLNYIGHFRPQTGKPAEKISYVKAIPAWKWVIGSGLYTKSYNDILKEKEDKLNKKFLYIAGFLILIFFIIGLAVYLTAKRFRKNIEKSFYKFEVFFAKATEDNISLNVEDMEFLEFEILAKHTNELVSKIKDLNQNLEGKVNERTKELSNTNKTLTKTLSKLRTTEFSLIENEKMAALGELVAGVTHEINTPVGLSLTGITHFSSITKNVKKLYESDSLSQEEFEEYVNVSNELADTITINLNRAAEIIRSFKTVAIDQTSREKRKFNFKSYLDEILLSLRNKTKKMNIDFKIDCDALITINSYPGSISQIITNLVMNSLFHGFSDRTKGTIKISVKTVDNSLEIVYKDDGVGIPASHLDKIFEPFFTTKKGKGGNGLGLNIIQKIVVDELHGTITCQSKEGEGATFFITFPLT